MDKEKRIQLIRKFGEGNLTEGEEALLEGLIASGEVNVEDVSGIGGLFTELKSMPTPSLSESADSRFYEMLEGQAKKKERKTGFWDQFKVSFSFQSTLKLAYGVVLLVIGFGAGFWLRDKPAANKEIQSLSNEINAMKEVMMLSLLEKESTSERLKAVNLTEEFDDVSEKITKALFETLNQDQNVNVRLAAVEALMRYAAKPTVREGLIRAIEKQESPLVQVALAEVMVALNEKRSVSALEQLLKSEGMPDEIKDRIKESLKVLI